MGRRIIVTRPAEDAAITCAALQRAGFETIVAPLMTIVPRTDVRIADKPYQAIVVTSANSSRALGQLKGGNRLDAVATIAVGERSAEAARLAGQNDVRVAGGDVNGLVDAVVKGFQPSGGPVLYVSGVQTTGALEERLAAAGFEVDRVVAYEAVAAENLPEAVLEAVSGQIDASVILYSPRTAHIWCKLLIQANLADQGAYLAYYCLSNNVASVIREAFGTRSAIVTAREPNERAMIAAIIDAQT